MFFEPPPADADEPRPGEWSSPPPWHQPPEAVFAGLLPMREVLARTEHTLIVLVEIRAYEQGCLLEISAATRRGNQPEQSWIGAGHSPVGLDHPLRSGQAIPDTMLRFGVQYSDGTKATTTATPWWRPDRDQTVEPPVLRSIGGGGSNAQKDLVTVSRPLWLWPAPPAEPFDLVVEWPVLDIELTRHQLDGARIATAAHDARPYWPTRQ